MAKASSRSPGSKAKRAGLVVPQRSDSQAEPSGIRGFRALGSSRQKEARDNESVSNAVKNFVNHIEEMAGGPTASPEDIDAAVKRHVKKSSKTAVAGDKHHALGSDVVSLCDEVTNETVLRNSGVPDEADALAEELIANSEVSTKLKVFLLNKILEFYSTNMVTTTIVPNEDNISLAEVFELLSKLPAKELERAGASLAKKAAKWEGVPTVAPELYKDRKASEELVDFLRRAYGERGLLTGRLMTPHLDILDRPLADAVRSYNSHHGSLPDDINLPQKYEHSDRTTPRKQQRKQAGPR